MKLTAIFEELNPGTYMEVRDGANVIWRGVAPGDGVDAEKDLLSGLLSQSQEAGRKVCAMFAARELRRRGQKAHA